MSVFEIFLDGGTGMLFPVLPAIVGTAGLGVYRLVSPRRRPGASAGSVLIVLGSTAMVAANNWWLGLDVLRSSGAPAPHILHIVRVCARSVLVALIAVAFLCVLELLSAIRHRRAPEAGKPRTSVRLTAAAGWTALAVAASAVTATVARVAIWHDETIFQAPAALTPAQEFATTMTRVRIGQLGGALALVLGIVTLALAYIPRRRSNTNTS